MMKTKEKVLDLLQLTHSTVVRKCHVCAKLNESETEPKKCNNCHKSFLPLNYFNKVEPKRFEGVDQLFSTSKELRNEDLIKGLFVLW